MITSTLTRLDGNFIPVARTWWQLKSLSPSVLKTRFAQSPSPFLFRASTHSRHRFDNLIIRYRYANNRRTRYSPLANRGSRDHVHRVPLSSSIFRQLFSSVVRFLRLLHVIKLIVRRLRASIIGEKKWLSDQVDFYSNNTSPRNRGFVKPWIN